MNTTVTFSHRDRYIPGMNVASLTEVLLPMPHHGFSESLTYLHGTLHDTASMTYKHRLIHMEFTSVTMYSITKKQLDYYSSVIALARK